MQERLFAGRHMFQKLVLTAIGREQMLEEKCQSVGNVIDSGRFWMLRPEKANSPWSDRYLRR